MARFPPDPTAVAVWADGLAGKWINSTAIILREGRLRYGEVLSWELSQTGTGVHFKCRNKIGEGLIYKRVPGWLYEMSLGGLEEEPE